MIDRRSGIERRQTDRFKVTVDIRWENHAGIHNGTVSDISGQGCFVMAAGDLADGEKVFLYLPLGDGTELKLSGEVSNHVFEIGFAARFVDVTDEQMSALLSFIESNKEV